MIFRELCIYSITFYIRKPKLLSRIKSDYIQLLYKYIKILVCRYISRSAVIKYPISLKISKHNISKTKKKIKTYLLMKSVYFNILYSYPKFVQKYCNALYRYLMSWFYSPLPIWPKTVNSAILAYIAPRVLNWMKKFASLEPSNFNNWSVIG